MVVLEQIISESRSDGIPADSIWPCHRCFGVLRNDSGPMPLLQSSESIGSNYLGFRSLLAYEFILKMQLMVAFCSAKVRYGTLLSRIGCEIIPPGLFEYNRCARNLA